MSIKDFWRKKVRTEPCGEIGGRFRGAAIKVKYFTYNGVPVSWFLGDFNFDGKFWHAWASANGKPYQLHAIYYEKHPNDLFNITVLNDKTNYYYDEATNKLLTHG